ncbi:MAG: hypothetical protein ACRC28_18540 [Clostridium sp.]|uniref:hypothetical protein n=1 Tax=Clostridium sp. TaxID=1506 RepID=UPI003F2BD138
MINSIIERIINQQQGELNDWIRECLVKHLNYPPNLTPKEYAELARERKHPIEIRMERTEEGVLGRTMFIVADRVLDEFEFEIDR